MFIFLLLHISEAIINRLVKLEDGLDDEDTDLENDDINQSEI